MNGFYLSAPKQEHALGSIASWLLTRRANQEQIRRPRWIRAHVIQFGRPTSQAFIVAGSHSLSSFTR